MKDTPVIVPVLIDANAPFRLQQFTPSPTHFENHSAAPAWITQLHFKIIILIQITKTASRERIIQMQTINIDKLLIWQDSDHIWHGIFTHSSTINYYKTAIISGDTFISVWVVESQLLIILDLRLYAPANIFTSSIILFVKLLVAIPSLCFS